MPFVHQGQKYRNTTSLFSTPNPNQLYVTKLLYSVWWQIFWNVVSSHILRNDEKFIKFALFTVGIVVVVVFENHNKFIKFCSEVLGARTFTCCGGFLMGMSALEENTRWLCQINRIFRQRNAFTGLKIMTNTVAFATTIFSLCDQNFWKSRYLHVTSLDHSPFSAASLHTGIPGSYLIWLNRQQQNTGRPVCKIGKKLKPN